MSLFTRLGLTPLNPPYKKKDLLEVAERIRIEVGITRGLGREYENERLLMFADECERLAKQTRKRPRGRPKGGGFKSLDRMLWPIMAEMVVRGEANSVSDAARMLVAEDRVAGNGGVDSKARRLCVGFKDNKEQYLSEARARLDREICLLPVKPDEVIDQLFPGMAEFVREALDRQEFVEVALRMQADAEAMIRERAEMYKRLEALADSNKD